MCRLQMPVCKSSFAVAETMPSVAKMRHSEKVELKPYSPTITRARLPFANPMVAATVSAKAALRVCRPPVACTYNGRERAR